MDDLDVHLRAIAAGDADAFARWVSGAEHRLRASVMRFATKVDVEVVVQETLLRAWQVAPRVRPDGRGNSLLRLAIRMARNLAIDFVRRDGRYQLEDLERLAADAKELSEHPAPPDPLLRKAIESCRSELPRKPAQVLTIRLAAAGGIADEELAARIGMRLNTFLQNFTRARRMLAKCLEGKGIDVLGRPS